MAEPILKPSCACVCSSCDCSEKQKTRSEAYDLLNGVALKIDALDHLLIGGDPITLGGAGLCGFCLILQDIRRDVSEAAEKIQN